MYHYGNVKGMYLHKDISSDDDSWIDLLEEYDSDESIDDNEKTQVKKMLIDIENIKKRLSHNNFTITCSFSLSIKNIFIRLWKRKSPLRRQNKSNGFRSFTTFHLAENDRYIGNKNSSIYGKNKSKVKRSMKQDGYVDVEEGEDMMYNITSSLREHKVNMFQKKDKHNIMMEVDEDDSFCNENFITLNENLQKNMFNNMQYAIPLYTFVLSEIFFVAKMEKNNFTYILYSMNGVDVRDETNITLLSMSSIYHSESKFTDHGGFTDKRSQIFTKPKSSNFAKIHNEENQKKLEKLNELEKVGDLRYSDKSRNLKTGGGSKNGTAKETKMNAHRTEKNIMIETEDTFLDYSISSVDLPDLEKTHLVLLYFGYLFKNNHTFKFILNGTKVKIFWEIIDEFLTWVLNINELLPKINTIEEDITRKLDESEDIHLNFLQKIQHINYDIICFKHSNTIVSGKGTYKIAIGSLINYYSMMFQCNEIENNQSDEINEAFGYANERDISYIDTDEDPTDKFYLITDDKSLCCSQYNTIISDSKDDVHATLKEMLFHENYFFNYIFNKINKKKNVEKILKGHSVKYDNYNELNKTNKEGEKIYYQNNPQSVIHRKCGKIQTPNDQPLECENDPYNNNYFQNREKENTRINYLDELEDNCYECLHLKNLNYTAYTKEVCKSKAYPYVHVDIEINYFECWVSLDPIRIPQKIKNSHPLNVNGNKIYYDNGNNIKSKQLKKNSIPYNIKEGKKRSITKRRIKGYNKEKIRRKKNIPFSSYEQKESDIYYGGEYPDGECDMNYGEEEKKKKKFKFREKVKWHKNTNIDKPYVLVTKGCLKSVIFFLLYKECLQVKEESRKEAKTDTYDSRDYRYCGDYGDQRDYLGYGENFLTVECVGDKDSSESEIQLAVDMHEQRKRYTKKLPPSSITNRMSQTVSNNSSNSERRNNLNEQMEVLRNKVIHVMDHSNLNNVLDVNDFLRTKFMQWINQLSSYLPCIVNMNIFLSQITSAISKPVTKNPFLKAYIDWNNVPYSNILLQPCRVNLNLEMKIPSPEILIERFLGINRITSLKIAKKDNIIYQNEVEGINMNFSFEPIILNVDSNTLTLLNQLGNIMFEFSNYFINLCSSKENEKEEEFLLRVNSSHDHFYDNESEHMIDDRFYFNVMNTSTSAMSSDYSLGSIESPISNQNNLKKNFRSLKKDELSKLFVSFCLNSENKKGSKQFHQIKPLGDGNCQGVNRFETIKNAIARQNGKGQYDQRDMCKRNDASNGKPNDAPSGELNDALNDDPNDALNGDPYNEPNDAPNGEPNDDPNDYSNITTNTETNVESNCKSNDEEFFLHDSKKSIVKNKNDHFTQKTMHEQTKSQTEYLLDTSIVNMLMMNFIENVKINCNVNFDVITLQIWDSNTAYNRCSLNFVIEYIYFHMYSLNVYEQNVGKEKIQMFDEKKEISSYGSSHKYGTWPNALCVNTGFYKENPSYISMETNQNCSNPIRKEKNSHNVVSKYEEFVLREKPQSTWFPSTQSTKVFSFAPNMKCTKEINKREMFSYSKSAVECLNKKDSEKYKGIVRNATMVLNNVENANPDNQVEEIHPIVRNQNYERNFLPDSIKYKEEGISNRVKKDQRGWKKLFDRNNFVRNIEQFNGEIKKLLHKIFVKKKAETEMDQDENRLKNNSAIVENNNKKYKNVNNRFVNNEFMFNDIINYNENKKSKNVECKVEFLVYCENFNKKENSYQTFIEPVGVEIIAVKKDFTSPIHLYYYFSWININFNFNFLDNILSLCCSIIFSIITQRTRLLLGRHINELDKKQNQRKVLQSGKNEKNEDLSSKNVHINHLIYQTECDENNTEKKYVSEMDDTHTSMYFPNFYGTMNDEKYKDVAILTNDNILFRYNKFNVLNSVNRSLDTYIFGEFILEKLLRNYQYSCQYPGDYLAKYENEFNVDRSDAPSEQLLHIKLFNYIKRKKRLEMNNICKINNLLGQPIAICTIRKKGDQHNDDRDKNYMHPNNSSMIGEKRYFDAKNNVLLGTIDKISKRNFMRKRLDQKNNFTNSSMRSSDKGYYTSVPQHASYDKKKKSCNYSHVGEEEKEKEVEKEQELEVEKDAENEAENEAENSSNHNDMKAEYTDTSTTNSRNSLKYQWKIIANNESLDLPTYDNGKVMFFLIRFRLLNYIYDIPSSILNTENENEDVIRLVIPERRLPPNINEQVEQELYNEQLLEMENTSIDSNYHTIYPNNYISQNYNNTNKEENWKSTNIPQPRNHLFIFFRTSSRVSHEEKQEYDFFISSIIAVKNNTDFPLYIFKSVPGNAHRNGIFKEYFHKYNMIPSPPPTYTLKIDKKIEKFIEHTITANNVFNDEKKKKKSINNYETQNNLVHKVKNIHNSSYLHSGNEKEKTINYIQKKSYLYGRKYIKNIFPLMKLSSVEHYISGDIKFSSLAPLKYKKKKKKRGKKSKLKYELQKKFIKKKIKEIYLKRVYKKTRHKKINKYENGQFPSEKFLHNHGRGNPYRNIMSINDSFFSFAKKSSTLSVSSSTRSVLSPIGKKLTNASITITDFSNITVSSLSSSIFSIDSTQSNSSVYGNSLYDYDKDNSEEQGLLNEYFKSQQLNPQNSLDLIKIPNNSNKLIPIPLYWLVAENSFIWISIQNERIYKNDLYEFLNDNKNADLICAKGTLDNMLNYQSPFFADKSKVFKPYLIKLKNHLQNENKILTKGENKNNENLMNNYNLNYINLKELYFTSTIISVYNPNYVLHKKDAHNFFQINIDHALMINNGLPRTMYLNYEIIETESTKILKKSSSIYTDNPSQEICNIQKVAQSCNQSLSVDDSCLIKSEDNIFDQCSCIQEFTSGENFMSCERPNPSQECTMEQTFSCNEDDTQEGREINSTHDNHEGGDNTQEEGMRGKGEFFTQGGMKYEQKYGQKNAQKYAQKNDGQKSNEQRKSIIFTEEPNKQNDNKIKNTLDGELNSMNDKEILLKDLNNDKNVFIYKNKKKENNKDEENIQDMSYIERNNFIVQIKKNGNKIIYEIKINPGQSIKLPFTPHNVNISFDGYNSRNISINYPHKKGREKIILEKQISKDMASFFSLDYETEVHHKMEDEVEISRHGVYSKSPQNYNSGSNSDGHNFDTQRTNNLGGTLGDENKKEKIHIGKENINSLTVSKEEIKDITNDYAVVDMVDWTNDKILQKRENYKTSKFEEQQKQLTIWAIFNEYYETGRNRYQDISLEKIHHGTYAVSCTFFVSACVINRLNYPISLKVINNDNTIHIEPYVRKLLPCEFSLRRNKVIISYETLKKVKNWVNYPSKKFMIRKNKLNKSRNIMKKNSEKIGTNNQIMEYKKINSKVVEISKSEEIKSNTRMVNTNKTNNYYPRKKRKNICLFYRTNVNKPLESEDFRITDLSVTRLTCSSKNKNNPQLKYSIYMSIAPMPFFRTTVMEILPYIVIINNTKMNIVFQEFIKNYTYFKYNTLKPGAYVEFHPQSKKKAMLKICGIFHNKFSYMIDDYLQKELYLENLEKENVHVVNEDRKSKCLFTSRGTGSSYNVPISHKTADIHSFTLKNNISNISKKLSVLMDKEKAKNHMIKQEFSSNSLCRTDVQNSIDKDQAGEAQVGEAEVGEVESGEAESGEVESGEAESGEAEVEEAEVEEILTNLNSIKKNNVLKKYKKLDDFKFLYWSEVLDLTRVSMIYFRHPVVSDDNFIKEEKKLKKLNQLLKIYGKNDITYLNMSNEIFKENITPYEYTCCSMEISTYKGCKFVRFQDIDVVPYYLLNLTKYNIKLRQLGIYEHSEVLQRIQKKKKKSFDEIFKNYAFNFSFYNPYKDPKLKISIYVSNKKKEKNKKKKKSTKKNNKNNNLKYTKTLKINLKNELNYLSLLATNYLKDNEYTKIIKEKIFHLKRFSEHVENLNDRNVNIIDLANSSNVTLLKLKHGDTFVYILCTKKTYNGKTIFSFENYDDLISKVLNFRKASFNQKKNYNFLKSFHMLIPKKKNAKVRSRKRKQKKKMKSKNEKNTEKEHHFFSLSNREEMKKRRLIPNGWQLLNLFRKKSTTRSIENGPRVTQIIRELYEKRMMNRQEKKKSSLNLNIFAHFIFKGLGLSINKHNLEEILYFSMEYILIVYKQITDKDLFHINIGWLQIDNHTKNTDYKNVLLPIVDMKKSNQEQNSTYNEENNFSYNKHGTFEKKISKEDITTVYSANMSNSNDIFSQDIRNENKLSKINSRYTLTPLEHNKSKSYDDYSYFEKENLLINPNMNNPLSNSYKFFVPSFFYSQHNSVLNITIIKQKRGNMKNFLELSEVNIKFSPMSINVDSYFIIEILKIFDELLKILEFDLSNYNSLNLEKNIELRDTDYDSLEYKQNIGPIEELIKHYILKDYYLYEQIANFKFNIMKNDEEKSKGIPTDGSNGNTIFTPKECCNKSDLDMPDVKTYLTMINEYKNWKHQGDNYALVNNKERANLDLLFGQLYEKNVEILGIPENEENVENEENDRIKHIEKNVVFSSNHHDSLRKIEPEKSISGEEKLNFQITNVSKPQFADRHSEEKIVSKKHILANSKKKNIVKKNYNIYFFNEEKLKYLQSCEKYYKKILNNRKRVLKKIQNINLKNNLISFDKMFISKLEIDEIKLIINIKNRSLSYDKKSEIIESNVMNALIVLIMNIPNISDAHLHFEKEIKKNMCGSLHGLIFNEIMNDYINPGMNQMFNVLGAVDFIGNPLIIYKHWKKGYNTFIKDLKKSFDSCSFPFLFCILLLNILGRFGKSLLSGILEGVSRLCGSWSTCLERFSRNADNFSIVTNSNILQNEILDQPSNCAEGIGYGCQSFVNILTISCVNTIYKPLIAIKKSRDFRKNEKDKFKIFLLSMKLILYGLFSGFSSLFFGFFNSILSFFTFLFMGTLNQIQTLAMKSVVRPKKMSIVKEYAKFVNYEYPLSFSYHIINEKKKKKEFLKKNIIAIIPLYSIKDNNPCNVKSFLWVNNKEVGYSQKDKLLWSLYINYIIKIDILLIQMDNGQGKKKKSILNRNKNKIKSKHSNFSTNSNAKEEDHQIKSRWNFQSIFNAQKYRQLGELKPSYYIRILYRSVYKVKRTHRKSKLKHFSLRKKDDSNHRMKKILRKNTYEKYFEKEFKNEQLINHDADQSDDYCSDDNPKAGHKDCHKYSHKNDNICTDKQCDHGRPSKLKEKDKMYHKNNAYDMKKDEKRSKRTNTNKGNREGGNTQCDRYNDHEIEKNYPKGCRSERRGKLQNIGDYTLSNDEIRKKRDLKRKGIYPYQQDAVNINDDSRNINKLKHKKMHAKKHHVHKKKKYLYISKLVKCESKEIALHAFSLLLSFLIHKSPYYLKTAN